MKIAVSAAGPTLDAAADPRFGRCPYFVVVETDDMSFHAVQNVTSLLGDGAGIQSARLIWQMGAKVVLTGSCGPNARRVLLAAGLEVVDGCRGTVREAVARFGSGPLAER